MSRRIKVVTGYVIGLIQHKDADSIVCLVDTSGVKVGLYAKSLRGGRSRKAFAIDLLNLVRCSVDDKGSLAFIQETQLLASRRSEITSLHGLITLQLVCELIDKFTLADHEQPLVFIWLAELVPLINNDNNLNLLVGLMLKLLDNGGVLPDLKLNPLDGTLLDEANRMLATDEVGYRFVDNATHPVSDRIVKSQLFLTSQPFGVGVGLQLKDAEYLELWNIVVGWVNAHLGMPLKTDKLLVQSLQSTP